MEEIKNTGRKDLLDYWWQNHPGPVMVVDQSLEVLSANPDAQKLISSLEEEDHRLLINKLPVVRAIQSQITIKDTLVSHKHYHFRGTLVPFPVSKCLVLLHDIGREMDLERKIQEANQELDDIVETSADGIVTVDGEGKILRINRAYEEIVGIKADEFIGRPVVSIKEEGYLDDLVSLHVLRDLKAKTLYFNVNGKEVLLTGRPVFNEEGKLIRIIANIRDMSELNKLKEKLKDMNSLTDRYKEELKKLQETELYVNYVAKSSVMKEVQDLAYKAARVNSNVLICGESGTGKEFTAKLIHKHSERADAPFLAINCSVFPPALVESELFGYEGGSFTGADKKGKVGLLEAANQGTVFLDEVAEMPLEIQVKLLRALEENKIRRVGGNREIPIDIRWIFATNQDLRSKVSSGEFREDLYYRLNVIEVMLPPLRERKEDIPLLANHFLDYFNSTRQLSDEMVQQLIKYSWPGNIRELRNVIERLVVLDQKLDFENDLSTSTRGGGLPNQEQYSRKTLQEIMDQHEKEVISEAYRKYGSTRKTAEKLGVSQPTVVRKLQKFKCKK